MVSVVWINAREAHGITYTPQGSQDSGWIPAGEWLNGGLCWITPTGSDNPIRGVTLRKGRETWYMAEATYNVRRSIMLRTFAPLYASLCPRSVNDVYGPARAEARRTLLATLTGSKWTKTASGWNRFFQVLTGLIGLPESDRMACSKSQEEAIHREIMLIANGDIVNGRMAA